MNDDDKLEKQLQDKGLNAPRLTPDLIKSVILTEQYYVFPGTTLTVCALTLRNGFHVIGESASASPENFDPDIGRQVAFDKALKAIWPLEGYLLREKLSQQTSIQQAATATVVEV